MNRPEPENRDLFAIADLAREFGISTRATDEGLAIDVRDTGRGIAKEHLAKLSSGTEPVSPSRPR